jgi:hypothetical protein
VIVTRITILVGIVLFGFFCWLAVAGFTALGIVLITATVLGVMIGGGHYLSGPSPHGGGPRR